MAGDIVVAILPEHYAADAIVTAPSLSEYQPFTAG